MDDRASMRVASGAQKVTRNDALLYLFAVRQVFKDEKRKYNKFKKVLIRFWMGRMKITRALARIQRLFQGHPQLLLGFNTFLPESCKIPLPKEEVPVLVKEVPPTVVKSINYVNKIKISFEHDIHIFKEFLKILKAYGEGTDSSSKTHSKVVSLFKDHVKLVEEFKNIFLNSIDFIISTTPTNLKPLVLFQMKEDKSMMVILENFNGTPDQDEVTGVLGQHPELLKYLTQLLIRFESDGLKDPSEAIGTINDSHEKIRKLWAEDEKRQVGIEEHRWRSGKRERKIHVRLGEDPRLVEVKRVRLELEHEIQENRNAEGVIHITTVEDKKKEGEMVKERQGGMQEDNQDIRTKNRAKDSEPEKATVSQQRVQAERQTGNKVDLHIDQNLGEDIVREWKKEEQRVISREVDNETDKMIMGGRERDCRMENERHRERSTNGEIVRKPAERSITEMEVEAEAPKNLGAIAYRLRSADKNRPKKLAGKVENTQKTNEGPQTGDNVPPYHSSNIQNQNLSASPDSEKFVKHTKEFDCLDSERCTPSYCLVPKNCVEEMSTYCTEPEETVLNDSWVAIMSGSENFSFKPRRTNECEEMLFRCEDDQFELDMVLELSLTTAKQVKEIMDFWLHQCTAERPFHLDDHLSAIHLRCIERLYGEHGLDIIESIRKDPVVALPVVHGRLLEKHQEWLNFREQMRKIWTEVYARNFLQSLDHRRHPSRSQLRNKKNK